MLKYEKKNKIEIPLPWVPLKFSFAFHVFNNASKCQKQSNFSLEKTLIFLRKATYTKLRPELEAIDIPDKVFVKRFLSSKSSY